MGGVGLLVCLFGFSLWCFVCGCWFGGVGFAGYLLHCLLVSVLVDFVMIAGVLLNLVLMLGVCCLR